MLYHITLVEIRFDHSWNNTWHNLLYKDTYCNLCCILWCSCRYVQDNVCFPLRLNKSIYILYHTVLEKYIITISNQMSYKSVLNYSCNLKKKNQTSPLPKYLKNLKCKIQYRYLKKNSGLWTEIQSENEIHQFNSQGKQLL